MSSIPFDTYDFFGYLSAGFAVLVGCQYTLGSPEILGVSLTATDFIALVVTAYLAGQMASTPAKWILERFLVHRVLKEPSINLMRPKSEASAWRHLFGEYFRPLQPNSREVIRQRALEEGLTGKVEGDELFEHVRSRDYIRSDTALTGTLNTFLNKYGLARNVGFVSLFFAAILPFIHRGHFPLHGTPCLYALIAGLAGILLFYRYLKFYREHAYELFLAYAAHSSQQPDRDPDSSSIEVSVRD